MSEVKNPIKRTEWVSNHLNGLARVLETAIVQLQESDEARQLAARNRNYKSYLQARNKEFTKLKTRRTEIEDRIEGKVLFNFLILTFFLRL